MLVRSAHILLLAIFSAPIVGPVSAESYTVAVNDAPPYRIIERSEAGVRYSGIYIDFMKEVAARIGLPIDFKDVPFKRALVMMERGDADFMLGPNRRPEREAYMVYLDVDLARADKVFYVKKDAPNIAGYGDLVGKQIAVLSGSTYFDRFDEDATLRKVEFGNYVTALRVVQGGRVDAVIIPELLGDHLILEHDFKLKKGSYVVEGRPSFITISRKSSLLDRRKEIEDALKAMKADGTLARIIDTYRK